MCFKCSGLTFFMKDAASSCPAPFAASMFCGSRFVQQQQQWEAGLCVQQLNMIMARGMM
jgi:hypothetical protein